MAKQGFNSLIKAQSSAVVFTDEATTTGDDISYQITDTSKRLWDLETPILVEDSAVPTTESFKVNRLTGTITFESAVSRTITVSGSSVTPVTVAQGKSFTFNGVREVLDNTIFQNESRTFQSGLLTGTAEIGRFYVDTFFFDQLLNGEIKILEFYADDSLDPIRAFGLVTSETIEDPVAGLVEESISFQLTDNITSGV